MSADSSWFWREEHTDFTISSNLARDAYTHHPARVTVDFFREPSAWSSIFELTDNPAAPGFEVRTKTEIRPKFLYGLSHGGVLVKEICPRSIGFVVEDLIQANELKSWFMSCPTPETAWRSLEWNSLNSTSEPAETFRRAIQEVYSNGGMLFQAFAPADEVSFKKLWKACCGCLRDEFWLAFLSSNALARAFPDLKPDWERLKQTKFEFIDCFTLAGHFTSQLVCGGAYRDFRDKVIEAKNLATAFAESLVPTNAPSLREGWRYSIYRTFQPWAAWFHDVAWDYTWLIADETRAIVYFIAMTDTD